MNGLRILLLRHGNSDYNTISEVFSKSGNTTIPFHKYTNSNILTDSPLSFQGQIEIRNTSKCLEDFPIKYIFVSPLRRCLESSYFLTKDRINNKFEIIVEPELRENLMSHNDLPIYWKKAIGLNRYSNYDFREMKKCLKDEFWFVKFLVENEDFKENIKTVERFVDKNNFDQEKMKYISNMMRKGFPKSIEESEQLTKRTIILKEKLKNFVNYKKVFENKIIKDHEILLISHFNFINQLCFGEKDIKKFYTKFLTTGSLIQFNLNIS